MALITPQDLMARIDDPHTRIVDCRWYLGEPSQGRIAYDASHIPNAVFADLEDDLSGPIAGGRHPLPTPDEFDATLTRMGITMASTVVAYDDRGGGIAARLWWMLTDHGHQNTFVLDGGLQAWIEEGGELTPEIPDFAADGIPAGIATQDWTGIVGRREVARRSEDTIVADARAAERYRGETESIDPRAGHVPGAISLPMAGNLDGIRLKQPAELRAMFADASITAQTPTVMYCGSGVTACHNILAMEVAGLGRPALYVGSWSDWSSSDEPAATGPDPG